MFSIVKEADWKPFADQIGGTYSIIHQTIFCKQIRVEAPLALTTISFFPTEMDIHVVLPFVFNSRFSFEAIHKKHAGLFFKPKLPATDSGTDGLDWRYKFSSNDSTLFKSLMADRDVAELMFSIMPKTFRLKTSSFDTKETSEKIAEWRFFVATKGAGVNRVDLKIEFNERQHALYLVSDIIGVNLSKRLPLMHKFMEATFNRLLALGIASDEPAWLDRCI